MSEAVSYEALLYILGCIVALCGTAAVAALRSQPRSASGKIAAKWRFPGRVIFDSNREGRFAIYATELAAGANSQLSAAAKCVKLISSDRHDMFPDPSPDGSAIVFARTESPDRNARSEVWIAAADGSNQRKLADDATFPTFSADGTTVFFERGRKSVFAFDLSTSAEHQIFPVRSGTGEDDDFAKGLYQIAKPRVSADGRYVFFTSDKNGRWNAFYADLQTGVARHIHKGCEPAPYSRAGKVAWVAKRNYFSRSGIKQLDLNSQSIVDLPADPSAQGHEYFPSVANNDQLLLYSASSNRNPAHDSSNYQVFLRDLSSGATLRVTHDNFTNRWPKLLPPLAAAPRAANDSES